MKTGGTTHAKKILLALLVGLIVPLTVAIAATEKETIENPLGKDATFTTIIERVTGYANALLAPLSALMVLIAGLLYMTGGGNPEKIKTAHKVLLWALVGIGIVLLSSGAVAIVKNLLGTK